MESNRSNDVLGAPVSQMLEANPTIARAGQGEILSQAALRAANMAALSSLFPDISLSSDLNL